ncbi:hypothetical protein H4R20_002477 [Coemansia guatemalensis]|uniref:Chitin-binding type-4 domain-containing protein n=1 Tax=Coemansia guatemalensis TaxID=2761395 RepID=A0A9W8HX52_9FUNG|nr:hypothetical protein H4R20_002477 [Coemansia guatemalensis]
MSQRALPIARLQLQQILLVLLACICVKAHVEMKEPPPRHSQFSKFYLDNDDVDYNMKSPLGPIVGYPCRNFKAGPTQGTVVAGHPFRVQFDGVATHLGGDCQFAVSYDNGTTFAVIWDKLSSCFLDTTNGGYDVPVPDTIPAAKKAIFAWTWINGMGSREYYMNCADVRIENYGHQEPLTAHELLVVNLPGKTTVIPKTGREEDGLISLLKQRPFVTIGKPQDLAQEELSSRGSSGGAGADGDAPAEADPFANRVASADEDANDTGADEITSYVYKTHTVTDDDNAAIEANLDEGFTYSEMDNYRSRAKPGSGLTVLSANGDSGAYPSDSAKRHLGVDAPIPFDIDDTLLETHHLASNDNFDLWPSSTATALASASASSLEIDAPGASTQASAPLDLGIAQGSTEAASAADGLVTQFKTVTVDNTPLLQVVVLSNNTAVPSSLTIAYSA